CIDPHALARIQRHTRNRGLNHASRPERGRRRRHALRATADHPRAPLRHLPSAPLLNHQPSEWAAGAGRLERQRRHVVSGLVADWRAETRVGEELARELVAEQFAPLPRRSVELISEGWDYVVHLVGGEWAFRFPRRAVVVSGTERELAVLGLLAPQLPVGVPVPVHIGRPTERFAWPFFGARFLPGVEAGEATLSDDERARMARPLARALRAVHGPAVLAELGGLLPFDPIRRADM